MTIAAAATLASNDSTSLQWSDNSFIGTLHECHRWNADAYFHFEAALYDLCERRVKDENARKAIDRIAARVFGYTMLMFSCHFDSDDGFTIENLSDVELRCWRERFQLVIEGFFGPSGNSVGLVGFSVEETTDARPRVV